MLGGSGVILPVSMSTIDPYAIPVDGVADVTGDDDEAELVEEVQALVNSPTRTSTDIPIRRTFSAVRKRSCVIATAPDGSRPARPEDGGQPER